MREWHPIRLDALPDDTTPTGCPNSPPVTKQRGAFKNKTLAVKGTTGNPVHYQFRGPRSCGNACLYGGTPAAAALSSNSETIQITAVRWWSPTDSKWNTYRFTSACGPGAANVYYLNAFPTRHRDGARARNLPDEVHGSFPVMGGGTIKFSHPRLELSRPARTGGGPDSQPSCASPRKNRRFGYAQIDLHQPVTNVYGSTTFYPQWLLFDVTSVTARSENHHSTTRGECP